MRIGPIEFKPNPIFLAPMEDVSDPPFRMLCKRMGADLLYTEFISSSGLVHDAEDSLKKLDFHEAERPLAIQIVGGDIDQVKEAVGIVDQVQPDIIDINFGCPVRKVVRRDGGAGVLRDMPKMRAITEVVVGTANRPVTVKTRLGWSEEEIRIVEVVRMLQDIGVQAVAVHARTRLQMYKGRAHWEWLKRLKEDPDIHIPIIGNGDATSPQKIRAMFKETGVDAVMVGRGAIGNPWIFSEARALIETGESPAEPSWEERLRVVWQHLELKCKWLGERKGVLEMRRMYGGYFKGFPGSSRLRKRLMEGEQKSDVLEVLLNFTEKEHDLRVRIPEIRALQ